jgi:hypothetical protein
MYMHYLTAMLCGALLLLDYYAQYIVGSNSNVKRECRVCLQIDLPAHATLSLGVQRSGGRRLHCKVAN